jgi:capsular polysaccharide transport system permease protein
MELQRDIAHRRRRKLRELAMRLAAFILLPTLLVAIYQAYVVTPLFATSSEFVIQTSQRGTGGGGTGGLLAPGGVSGQPENITVQAYLQSREAMLRLDEEIGFRAHFSAPGIDPLTRLAPDATMEDVYATYRRNLTIGYDPTEGLIRMEVLAATPEASLAVSQALIRFAEERVAQMNERLREDVMAGARESLETAEARALAAQERVLQLQERVGFSPFVGDDAALIMQIAELERDLRDDRLRLDTLLEAPQRDDTRVALAERGIQRQEAMIQDLRALLNARGSEAGTIARLRSDLVMAEAELETRHMLLAQALAQMESARVEAGRQTLRLVVGVAPIAPDAAASPRIIENTLVALLVLTGTYLLISMTISILREQVSS